MTQHNAQSQAIAQQAATFTPPGWYPDPVTGSGERYWDGIAWSREFTRPGPGQQPMPQPAMAQPMHVAQYPATNTARSGLTKGIIPMVIASILFVSRVVYFASYWEDREAGTLAGTESYNQGALVGTIVGFFLTGLLFMWGMNRYRSASESPTGEPADVSFGEVAPKALIIALAGAGISYLLGTQ